MCNRPKYCASLLRSGSPDESGLSLAALAYLMLGRLSYTQPRSDYIAFKLPIHIPPIVDGAN